MKYRTTRDLLFSAPGAELVRVPKGAELTAIPDALMADDEIAHVRRIRKNAARSGVRRVFFRWDDGLRSAVIGDEVEAVP